MESIYKKINRMTSNHIKVICKSDIRRYITNMKDKKRLQDILGRITKLEKAVKGIKHQIVHSSNHNKYLKYKNKYIIILGYNYYSKSTFDRLIVYTNSSDFNSHVIFTNIDDVQEHLKDFMVSENKKNCLLTIADDFMSIHSNLVDGKTLCFSNTFRPQVYSVPEFIKKFDFDK